VKPVADARPRGPGNAALRAAPEQLNFLFDATEAARAPAADRPQAGSADTAPLAEPRPASVGAERALTLAGEAIRYGLRRAKRRTIGFQIDDRGLTVSAPRWVSVRDIEAAIAEKERWIRSRLQQWREWQSRRQLPQIQFAEGGRVPYLGGEITLHLRPDLPASVLVTDEAEGGAGQLRLALPADAGSDQVRDAVQSWLKSEAQRVLGARLALLAQRGGVQYSAWALSSARGQWGSCTAQGRIRLNWRLIHFSVPVIDYVVAHELAHLRELNHSPAFWREVAALLPGFEAARDHIRTQDLSALPL
jgi:predicted metal-dependent hydrolase